MRKTDKKTEKKLRQILTELCETTLQEHEGYQWISHEVNYNRFPNSLLIRCMFTDKQSAQQAKNQGLLVQKIKHALAIVDIDLKKTDRQIRILPA